MALVPEDAVVVTEAGSGEDGEDGETVVGTAVAAGRHEADWAEEGLVVPEAVPVGQARWRVRLS